MQKIDSKGKELAVLILAAGKGKRMNNPDLPKVMANLKGIPLIGHVLKGLQTLLPNHVLVIVGHQKEKVIEYLSGTFGSVDTVVQEEQLGTGHAVAQAKSNLSNFNGDVLILSGDVPLMRGKTLESFIEEHRSSEATISVLTALVPDATGYGRIVRDSLGRFVSIVEHKDADDSIRQIKEINSGIYCVDSAKLFESLEKVNNNNVQGEYYLTDIIALLYNSGERVVATSCNDYREIMGINTSEELTTAEALYSQIHES